MHICCGLEIIQQALYVVGLAALLRSDRTQTQVRDAHYISTLEFDLSAMGRTWLPVKLTLTASSMLPKGTTTPRGVAKRPEDLPRASSSPHVAAFAPQVSGCASGRLTNVQPGTWAA